MRIFHLTTFLQGGAGLAITTLAIAQRRAGHDVRVIADAGGDPGYGNYEEYVEALADAGVPLRLVRSTFKRDRALNVAAASTVAALARRWAPQVVHTHAAVPAVIAELAGLRDGATAAAIVHTMHGWGVSKTPEQAAHDLSVLAGVDLLVTPSAAARDQLLALGLDRDEVCVVPYGIADEAPGRPDERDVRLLAAHAGRRVALCIGTVGERKNQRLLVDALAAPALRDVVAVFIGDGDPEPLERRAAELDVRGRTIVLGHRSGASRYLPLAGALVLPSRNEGLPLVVLEALAAGVPIVASNLPEIAEAAGPELAEFLFESDDATALAQALGRAVAVPDRERLARRMRRRFEAHYTADRMIAAYDALYAKATAAGSNGRRFARRITAAEAATVYGEPGAPAVTSANDSVRHDGPGPRARMIAIVGFQRSGTTMVRSLLASHDGLAVHGEILDAPERVEGPSFWRYFSDAVAADGAAALPERRPELFRAFLREMLEADCPRIPVVDIKFNSFHHANALWHNVTQRPAILDVLAELDVTILHVYRRNRLKRLVSAELARETGMYRDFVGKGPRSRQVRVDVQGLLWLLQHDDAEAAQARALLQSYPDARTIYYESLYKGDSRCPNLGPLTAYLDGIDIPGDLRTDRLVYKLASDNLRDVVENWDELSEALQDTPYARYLEER